MIERRVHMRWIRVKGTASSARRKVSTYASLIITNGHSKITTMVGEVTEVEIIVQQGQMIIITEWDLAKIPIRSQASSDLRDHWKSQEEYWRTIRAAIRVRRMVVGTRVYRIRMRRAHLISSHSNHSNHSSSQFNSRRQYNSNRWSRRREWITCLAIWTCKT